MADLPRHIREKLMDFVSDEKVTLRLYTTEPITTEEDIETVIKGFEIGLGYARVTDQNKMDHHSNEEDFHG